LKQPTCCSSMPIVGAGRILPNAVDIRRRDERSGIVPTALLADTVII
jgi:hypothetical protein